MKSITLQLDWKPNSQFAGILWAHHLGWYSRAGIDLDIRPWESHINPVDELNNPGRMVVSTEDHLLIQACAKGFPAQAVASMFQNSTIGWVALQDSGIHNMLDLKGKRIGIHSDGWAAVKVALAYFDMSPEDVDIVEIGFDYGDILRSGECQAVQCLVMVEPLELEEKGFVLNVMPAYRWGYKAYSQVMAVPCQFIESDRELLEKFLRITFDGWRDALKNTAQICQVITSEYLPETNPRLENAMLNAMREFIVGDVGMERLGWMNSQRWEESIQSAVTSGLVEHAINVNQVMTNDLMQAIYKGG
jgi:NitT/TauT family transport system substrate-binding protein